MSVTLLLVIIFGIGTSLGEEQVQLKCLQCSKVRRSFECNNTYVLCNVGQLCQTTAYYSNEGLFYSYGCGTVEICKSSVSNLIGKRFLSSTDIKPASTPTDITPDPKIEMCMDCCGVSGCNNFLCPERNFMKTAPTADTLFTTDTTPLTTMLSTTAYPVDPNCRDLEEDGIKCDVLDFVRICDDTSMFAQFLRWKKCPKFCGICRAPENASSTFVTPRPGNTCQDYEQDGIRCVYLDAFDMCTGRSSVLSILVANAKCRRHCGICHDTTTIQSTTTTTSPSTSSARTSSSTTAPPTTRSGMQTLFPCIDFETSTVHCAQLKADGHCLPVEGIKYETAKLRCRKTCGFC